MIREYLCSKTAFLYVDDDDDDDDVGGVNHEAMDNHFLLLCPQEQPLPPLASKK